MRTSTKVWIAIAILFAFLAPKTTGDIISHVPHVLSTLWNATGWH